MSQVIKITSILLLFTLSFSALMGQNGYWVFYNSKCDNDFNPYNYFDEKAIERRVKEGIKLFDQTDLPVCENYIQQTAGWCDSIGYASRWFNAQFVYTDLKSVETISTFDFVKKVVPANYYQVDLAKTNYETGKGPNDLVVQELNAMEHSQFIANNWKGEGVRVAIFDAGFTGVNAGKAFKHIRDKNKFIGSYDFVKKKDFVYAYSTHGTNVLSCIAGKIDTLNIGMATDAEFLLARTENAMREPLSEEQNWLAAVEWADKNGAHIINSSLSYTFHHHFNWEMNGKSMVAQAANLAARKGILVVNAAGNDGDKNWKFIGTPADADSALTVGGISPETGYHIEFSSFGPTTDLRLKPNVVSFGKATVAGSKGTSITQGTSFASPLVAGFAACVLSGNKSIKTMDLYKSIEQSADLYPYYDYAHGYGLPKASHFFETKETPQPTFKLKEGQISLTIMVDSIYANEYLYYHIKNKDGIIKDYYVIEVNQIETTTLSLDRFTKEEELMIHYNGYTQTHSFKK